jgi:alpha-beta hydrolase superfamily lysophospholipase
VIARCRAGAAVGLMAIALGTAVTQSAQRTSIDRASFRTDDGVFLTATWYAAAYRPAPAVILVPMYRRPRRDWDPIGRRLSLEGISALAIDLRGHGDSGGTAPDPPQDLAPLVLDVKAARRYLASRGDVVQSRVGVLGASLGATLAVLAAAGDPTIASLALLSPSIDYRGLRIESPLRKLARPVLLVAGDDDPYAHRSARELQQSKAGTRELLVLPQAGHGTTMIMRAPDLAASLVDWFRRTLL